MLDLGFKRTSRNEPLENTYYTGYGRAYGAWISGRGYTEGEPILNPSHMIESLIRDEINVERFSVAQVTKLAIPYTLTIEGLTQQTADAYKDAYVMFRLNHGSSRHLILSSVYNSGTTTITCGGLHWTDLPIALNTDFECTGVIDNIITNSAKIDTTSFDAVADELNAHKITTYNVAILQRELTSKIISDILRDLHLILYRDFDTYYLRSIYPQDTVSGTFDSPLISNGVPQIKVSKTELSAIYSDFTIPYKYLYSVDESISNIIIDANSTSPSEMSYVADDLNAYCKDANTKYSTTNMFELSTSNLSHPQSVESAFNIAGRLLPFHTKRKLVVTYMADILTYKDYKIGQQVKIDVPSVIPTGVNNVSNFIIFGRKIVTRNTNKYYEFTLLELPTKNSVTVVNPTDITSLTSWYKAGIEYTLNGSSELDEWGDSIHSTAQLTDRGTPLTMETYNGILVPLIGTSIGEKLIYNSSGWFNAMDSESEFTGVAVIRPKAFGGYFFGMWGTVAGSYNGIRGCITDDGRIKIQITDADNGNTAYATSAGIAIIDTPTVIAFQYNEANKSISIIHNNIQVTSTLVDWDLSGGFSLPLAPLTIGGAYTTDVGGDIDVFDFLVCNSLLTTDELTGVIAYMEDRWGI